MVPEAGLLIQCHFQSACHMSLLIYDCTFVQSLFVCLHIQLSLA